MKKILIALWLALVAMPAMAQQSRTNVTVTPNSNPQADNYSHVIMDTKYDNATIIFPVPSGMQWHQFTFKVDPSVSALTVTVSGSVGGSFSSIGSSSTLGGDTIVNAAAATYTQIKVVYSGYAGSGAVDGDYYGVTNQVKGGGGSGSSVTGTLTNNNAAPAANNLGVLPCVANVANPSLTEGDQVLCSVNLTGYIRSVLQAETTKVLGTVRVADTNGNPIQNSDIVTVYGATTADTTNSPLDCLVKSGTGTVNDTTNHANCKASAGNIVGVEAISTSASIGFIKLYNLATDPTCSSATGFIRDIPIPAAATGAGIYLNYIFAPEAFSTGIGYCITAAGGSTDNSAAPAGIFITFRYK